MTRFSPTGCCARCAAQATRSTRSAIDAALAAHAYDLLILDLGLPRLHGLEVLRRLRERGSTAPVLILTAAESVEQRVRGLDLGADDYMPSRSRCRSSRRAFAR